jgi:hypothetical protein
MDFGTNPENWGRMPSGGASPLLDWQGLRARFLASSATRRELGTDRPAAAAGGSFHDDSARILNGYGTTPTRGLAPVNPSALGDGKAPDGKTQPVAGNKWPVIEE